MLDKVWTFSPVLSDCQSTLAPNNFMSKNLYSVSHLVENLSKFLFAHCSPIARPLLTHFAHVDLSLFTLYRVSHLIENLSKFMFAHQSPIARTVLHEDLTIFTLYSVSLLDDNLAKFLFYTICILRIIINPI